MNNRLLVYLAFVIVVLGGGLLIGANNVPGEWYRGLAKPTFNPPDWVFAPAWSLLYVLIAIAGARTWLAERSGRAMRLWFAQLVFNFAWSPAFFGWQDPAAALVIVIALLVSVAAFILVSWRRDRLSATLFLPYLSWVAFATALNAAIVLMN